MHAAPHPPSAAGSWTPVRSRAHGSNSTGSNGVRAEAPDEGPSPAQTDLHRYWGQARPRRVSRKEAFRLLQNALESGGGHSPGLQHLPAACCQGDDSPPWRTGRLRDR
eukprot:15016586-Alexandrium_andersonii.AAC.1